MSSSVFKVYSSSNRDEFEDNAGSSGVKENDLNDSAVHEDLKIDSNLVILVNKDGTVSVDQNTLQSLLANETTDTSVSVVRISSPTPSIQNEIEEEQRRLKDEKHQMDADAGGSGGAGSSNEDSAEESCSVGGTSSGASSVTGVAIRRGRSSSKKITGTTMEDREDPKHVSLTVEAYYPPEEASNFAAQVLSLTGYQHPLRNEIVDIEFLKHTVVNDHCYTPLTSPTQRLPPRVPFEDLDSSDEQSTTLSLRSTTGKVKAITLMHAGSKIIDHRKSIGIKTNKASPMPIVSTGAHANRRKTLPIPIALTRQEQKPKMNKPAKTSVTPDPLELDDEDDEDDEELDFEYSDEEDSSYSEEDDDEMDVDFSVGARSMTKKRKQTPKIKPSPKTPQRSQYRKLQQNTEMKELTAVGVLKEGAKYKMVRVVSKPSTPVGKGSLPLQTVCKVGQSLKVVKKDPIANTRSNISTSATSSATTILPSKLALHGSSTSFGKSVTKAEFNQTKPNPASPAIPTTNTVGSVPKKEKKPKSNAHDAALFNDMTALFSTPDIIKKVNASKASTPTTPTGFAAVSPLGIASNISSGPPVIVKPLMVTSVTKTIEQKSVMPETVVPASLHPNPIVEQRLDLINAIVQEELRQPVSDCTIGISAISSQLNTQSMEIPSIVKMLETSSSAVDAGRAMMDTLLPEGKAIDNVEPPPPVDLLPESSILEALNSNVDALPEDLLEHVAELAKNKELQEILDKQVLGVISTDALLTTSVMPMASGLVNIIPEQPPIMMQTSASSDTTFPMEHNSPVHNVAFHHHTLTQNPQMDSPISTIKEQTMSRKEAIQIRRSDGRVITLPPIEAPATRASKRRAQGGTSTIRTSSSHSPIVATGPETAVMLTVDASSSQTPKTSRQPKSSVQTATASETNTPGQIADDDGVAVTGTGELLIDESKGKRSNKMRQSVDSRAKRASIANVAIAVETAQDDDIESDESWNSEDDPDRLWCICRQPHNNRFMICCDSCEDWFHGKCVNITKAMGQQMEQDGIEWTCPHCLKKKQDRQQPKMTAFLISNTDSKTGTTSTTAKSAQSSKTTTSTENEANCVVCSKPAKPSSIYCSDECIRKHFSNAVAGSILPGKIEKPREQVPFSASVSSPSVVNESNVIILMERKTGRCITGKNAPTAENVKDWLDAHPTFELVPPGSVQASIIIAKQAEVRKVQLAKEAAERKSASGPGASGSLVVSSVSGSGSGGQSPKIQSQLKINEQKKIILSTSSPGLPASKNGGPTGAQKAPSPKHASQKSIASVILSASGVKTNTSASTSANRLTPSTSVQQKVATGSSNATVHTPTALIISSASKQKKLTTPLSSSTTATEPARQSQSSKSTTTTPGGENIRVTVKKTLKEHLMQRTSELSEDPQKTRLTEEEIDRFVSNTERELFLLFNKDTGMKYRAKYRSLVFNIKDRKNLSLFQKISEKSIEPKQLVRMTADELASQELAQWRENETKHQLEMIKKSELDLLACAKNYVLKTHKGEEVIEGKTDDRVQLDLSAPVEDVVSLLNNSAVSSTSELDDSSSGLKDGMYRSKDYDYGGYGKSYAGIYGSGSISSSNMPAISSGGKSDSHVSGGGGGGTSSSYSSRKKESRRSSRSRSRSRGRKHNRERSRDRSRSKHKRKRSRERSHDRHVSRDVDRERERDRDRERDRERDRGRDRDRHHRERERSRERSRHDRKSSREKDSSKGSSEKLRSSTANRADGAEQSTKITPEAERKEDKSEAQRKLVNASKKRSVDSSKGAAVHTSTKASTEVEGGKPMEAIPAANEIAEKDRSKEDIVSPKESDTQLNEIADTATASENAVESKQSKMDPDQEPTSTVTIPTPPHYPYEGEPPEDAAVTVIDEQKLKVEKDHWKGSVHMVDVASVEMSIRAVSGDVDDVMKDFSEDLNICGTIKPEMVWEYIGQIKKSPNKEVCLVRFHSTESNAYYTLYNHLYTRKRYSVVRTPSAAIKDFYIFPLPAEQMIPMILKPVRGVGIVEGDCKPNLLLGILVKIKGGKRSAPTQSGGTQLQHKSARRQSKQTVGTVGGKNAASVRPSSTDSLLQQVITKYTTKTAQTPINNVVVKEGSNDSDVAQHDEDVVKNLTAIDNSALVSMREEGTDGATKTQSKSKEIDMDIDMDIIKAPIAGKASGLSSNLPMAGDGNSNSAAVRVTTTESSAMLIDDDDDEPYSPGGGSDDSNFADVTAIVDTSKLPARSTAIGVEPALDSESERIRLAMDELNRKIAEQKNEIVGLISMAELKEEEINSALPPSLIQDIPIPSNLSEILASIKGGSSGGTSIGSAGGSETLDAPSGAGASGMIVKETVPSPVDDADSGRIDDEEYNPTAPSIFSSYKTATVPFSAISVANSQGDIDERILAGTLLPTVPPTARTPFDMIVPLPGAGLTAAISGELSTNVTECLPTTSSSGESRLAKLSEEELLSMVPDDAILPDSSSKDA